MITSGKQIKKTTTMNQKHLKRNVTELRANSLENWKV